MVSAWHPETAAEAAMLAAVEQNDLRGYLAAIASGPLLLAVVDGATAGSEQPAWQLGEVDGQIHAIAFTSHTALTACQPDAPVSCRATTLADLAEVWPDPTWYLTINPGLVIGHTLAGEAVADFAESGPPGEDGRPQVTDPTGAPDEVATAIRGGDPNAFMAALIRATIVVPLQPGADPRVHPSQPNFPWWCLRDEEGQPGIPVFTSEGHLHEALGPEVVAVAMSMVALAESWPDPMWALHVNPGTEWPATIPGTSVRELADWFGELRKTVAEQSRQAQQEYEVEREVELPDTITLQLVIPPSYVVSYLKENYNRAAGLVHASLGPGNERPIDLYRRLNLLGDGSPFSATDPWVAVLRWAPNEETPEEWGTGEPRMEAVIIPDGAMLWKIQADRQEIAIARYDGSQRQWAPVT